MRKLQKAKNNGYFVFDNNCHLKQICGFFSPILYVHVNQMKQMNSFSETKLFLFDKIHSFGSFG